MTENELIRQLQHHIDQPEVFDPPPRNWRLLCRESIEAIQRLRGNKPHESETPAVCSVCQRGLAFVVVACSRLGCPHRPALKANDPLAQLEDDATFGEIVEEIQAGKL